MKKRILLTCLSVLLFTGMSVAQDVYSSGYYIGTNGAHRAAVYKNGTMLYDSSPGFERRCTSSDVVFHNGDVYWAVNMVEYSGTADDAYVYKNGDFFLTPSSYPSFLNGIYIHDLFAGNNLFAAGYKTTNGKKVAVLWKNSDGTPINTLGNGSSDSEAICGTTFANSTYVGGYQGSSGVIWKNSTVLTQIANTKILDITTYDGRLWFVGKEGSALKVWKMDTDGTNLEVKYTLVSSGAEPLASICIDANDVYVCSYGGDYKDVVWKNGVQLYTTGGYFYSVTANTNGVYYCGTQGGTGRIWKDGSVLYSPYQCNEVFGIYVAEPECSSSEIRSLPFTDGFENGNTSWHCWTTIDVDNNNGGNHFIPFWDRRSGGNNGTTATGDYCAYHGWGTGTQEGWLISPQLFLQPGRDQTQLTFDMYGLGDENEGTRSVYISTTDMNPSSFTQVWTSNSPAQWANITIDLKAYQGHAVYIAFKIMGNFHGWYIDNVSVTESWTPGSNYNVPYTYTFSDWPWQSTAWYNIDYDKSGGKKCWQYNSTENCAYHPYGQSGIAQHGCLYSPNITLPAGHDYVLKFKTKSTSSGSNMSNKIWLRKDGTGIPTSDQYLSLIWSDNQFSSSWTEVEVPLSAYAGHVISLEFNYQGTYAHNWFIKDVRVEQTIVQYTITANSNNNAWGTVTGGGTYNNGATCTLTATPESGYQFQSWKKNGEVVSTSPTYSFTVTESATYTAQFGEIPINYYTITVNASPAEGGSVTGGGTYQEGSSITLTATANAGYNFSQWNDGSTDNPRIVTVTSDASYTAQFTQNTYTVSVYANPVDGGTVTGGGTYTHGQTATLTATANADFEFQGWSDGSTDNPYTVTVTADATYTATFSEVGAIYYTIAVNAEPAEGGSVTGGGTYEEGTTVTLTATANEGYTFEGWSDGITQNPRTVTVTGNMNFTARFLLNQYTITVEANPATAGSVSGGGTYSYGSTATLRATAYNGYEFAGWSDGASENPHVVTVTGNATYKAIFNAVGSIYYTVKVQASPAGAGSVSGAGSYEEGTVITLTATPNEGYTFSRWNDGNTQNPRTVTVLSNMSFTAFFTSNTYTITANASPDNGGSVTGGGSYAYGASATLQAIANKGFTFMQWSDGVVSNPRIVTVYGNATYTALFLGAGGVTYTLTVTSNDPELGSVTGSGTYPAGASVKIAAFPMPTAAFLKWSDGNTDNPRTVLVNSNKEFVAEFAAVNTYTITVESANPTMGKVNGGGTFTQGSTTEISAVAFDGYVFTSWNDGNTDNPRTITVTGNATYTAHFAASTVVTHTVTLICNTTEGSVSGGGVYLHGQEAYLQAFPNDGFFFDKWNDGNTNNPRTITVTSDLTLVAFFKGTGVGENETDLYALYPNPATESIRIEGIEANTSIEIYNSLGDLVKVVNAGPSQEIGIRDLASGLYLVRFNNVSLRFVKTL